MNPIKPGTRCECDAEHGGPIHNRYQGLNIVHCQCKGDAVRVVTVHVDPGQSVSPTDTSVQRDFDIPMCAACADFHEKGGAK